MSKNLEDKLGRNMDEALDKLDKDEKHVAYVDDGSRYWEAQSKKRGDAILLRYAFEHGVSGQFYGVGTMYLDDMVISCGNLGFDPDADGREDIMCDFVEWAKGKFFVIEWDGERTEGSNGRWYIDAAATADHIESDDDFEFEGETPFEGDDGNGDGDGDRRQVKGDRPPYENLTLAQQLKVGQKVEDGDMDAAHEWLRKKCGMDKDDAEATVEFIREEVIE